MSHTQIHARTRAHARLSRLVEVEVSDADNQNNTREQLPEQSSKEALGRGDDCEGRQKECECVCVLVFWGFFGGGVVRTSKVLVFWSNAAVRSWD